MKINKKLVVPFMSTIVGLSIAGGLGGAFAWYQFNSQVRTGLVGTSVANGGVLQIGVMENSTIQWGTEKYIRNASLVPCTFGQLKSDGSLPLAYAYGYPEAGQQGPNDYTTGWTKVLANQGFYQYDIYLRALKADKNAAGDSNNGIAPGYKLVEQDVYLSDMVLEDAANTEDRTVAEALRVHYQVENGKNALISKTAIPQTAPLNLYGQLDLDADGQPDVYDGEYNWTGAARTPMTYGVLNDIQTTKGISDVVQARDEDGKMPASDNGKCICTTSTSTMTKITITVWLEGWSLLQVDEADPTPTTSAVWNPKKNAGVDVHVGMTFDAGRNILE